MDWSATWCRHTKRSWCPPFESGPARLETHANPLVVVAQPPGAVSIETAHRPFPAFSARVESRRPSRARCRSALPSPCDFRARASEMFRSDDVILVTRDGAPAGFYCLGTTPRSLSKCAREVFLSSCSCLAQHARHRRPGLPVVSARKPSSVPKRLRFARMLPSGPRPFFGSASTVRLAVSADERPSSSTLRCLPHEARRDRCSHHRAASPRVW